MKAKSDIVDIISKFIHLQKKGRDYWACCPFHHEKTPSFQVRSDHQYYKCYGCQKSGNVITFLMEHERMTYPEAIEWLASRAGMEIPEKIENPEFKEQKEVRQKIYNINQEAAKFYYNNLVSEKGRIALEYLFKRDITVETITRFGLGYSANSQELPKYLEKLGYDIKTLQLAGLVSVDGRGNAYDFFEGRLIIPIIDASGRVIAFGGRILVKSDFAKYKNTSVTPVFDKSRNLFALNLFKKLKQTEPVHSIILVEGYMDVISLYQAGIKNAVAPMGTSLTVEQCRIIKRYVDLVYVCFDGDSAGQKATMRSLDMLKESGLDVKVISIPDNKDPDDIIKEQGKEGFANLMTQALPLIDYKLKIIEDENNINSFDGKKKYANAAIIVLSTLDTIERGVYSERVSKISGLARDTILAEANGQAVMQKPSQTVQPSEQKDTADRGNLIASRFILSSILNVKNYVRMNDLSVDYFENPLHKQIFEYILKCIEKKTLPIFSDLFDLQEDTKEINEIIDIIEKISLETHESYYNQSFYKLYTDYKTKKMLSLVALLSGETDEEKKVYLKKQILELKETQPKK